MLPCTYTQTFTHSFSLSITAVNNMGSKQNGEMFAFWHCHIPPSFPLFLFGINLSITSNLHHLQIFSILHSSFRSNLEIIYYQLTKWLVAYILIYIYGVTSFGVIYTLSPIIPPPRMYSNALYIILITTFLMMKCDVEMSF